MAEAGGYEIYTLHKHMKTVQVNQHSQLSRMAVKGQKLNT